MSDAVDEYELKRQKRARQFSMEEHQQYLRQYEEWKKLNRIKEDTPAYKEYMRKYEAFQKRRLDYVR
jgi:hypothetical protein